MPKPNLLFLFTDCQRQNTMRAYGNPQIRTPNMDRLAEQGIVFTRTYVSQPVCTPSRSTIMTGLHPHSSGCIRNNIPLDLKIPTIAELFQDGDYRFAYHGKWHLGDEVFAQHGFDDWESIEDGYRPHFRPGRDRSKNCSYYYWLRERGFEPDMHNDDFSLFSRGGSASFPAEFSKPAFLAETMSRFIRENAGRPWVAYFNTLEPHPPFSGPYDELYDPDEITLPANFNAAHPDEPIRCRLIREHYRLKGVEGLDLSEESGWRRMTARYWGGVTLVDDAVGRILSTLSECGLDDDTIVVFTSDHGDMMGSHRLRAMTVMFEEAVKVPLIMRIPQLTGGPRRVDHPISQVDLVPTLLDLMGQPPPPGLDGHSLRPVLEGGAPQEPHVFVEWNGRDSDRHLLTAGEQVAHLAAQVSGSRTRSVISPDGWKLNLSEADKCELYNLSVDPGETENLYYSGAHQQVIERLKDEIKRWQARTADDAPV